MSRLLPPLMVIFLYSASAMADDGLVNILSRYDVQVTADRLEEALRSKGMRVFMRINHSEGAEQVGQALRPTELLIFGNPQVGTPLMQCGHSVAIDLPQKALVREDEAGRVWLSYNDPNYLARRHDLKGCEEIVNNIAQALSNFAKAATQP